MRRSRVPIADKRVQESKKNHNSSKRTTLLDPKVMRKYFSVNMVNPRSAKKHKTKESAVERSTAPAIEIDLETTDQSVDEVQRKTTESTPMPNVEEQEKKTIELSPIYTVDDTTNNSPETIKEDSQSKRTSFTERIVAMVGMKPREKEEVVQTTEKSKTFGRVSAITTEAKQDYGHIKSGATAKQRVRVPRQGCQDHHEKRILKHYECIGGLKHEY